MRVTSSKSIAIPACNEQNNNESTLESYDSEIDFKEDTSLTVSDEFNSNMEYQNFNVYEKGQSHGGKNEFSIKMCNNPITRKMKDEIHNEDFSTETDIQQFYSGYVEIWKKEIDFSIENLEVYLDDEEKAKFEHAQENWKNSLETNYNFDNSIITNNSNVYYKLGSQYSYSMQLYI